MVDAWGLLEDGVLLPRAFQTWQEAMSALAVIAADKSGYEDGSKATKRECSLRVVQVTVATNRRDK